mmetsp:Transcript_7577/g.12507  ORF Transcript_7577/g.12507 Transcript_7577/m.12507 type:complete len:181 (-) Transcript_7577:66-608(-)
MIVKNFNVKIAVKKKIVKDAIVNFVLKLVGLSRNASDVQTKYAVGVPLNLRVYDAIQSNVGYVVILLESVPSVYVIGVVTAYLQLCAIIVTISICLSAANAFQKGNATNVTILFAATVGRFQNANCVSKGVAATVIHQGLGVEMEGMDTVLNVLINRLTLEWKIEKVLAASGVDPCLCQI